MDTPTPSAPMDQGKALSALAYIGPFIIVSYLLAKDNASVKFHVKQGAVVFVIEVVVWILSSMFWFLWPLWQVVNLAALILSIIGIVNALQGKEKELPLVGSFSKHIPI